MKTKAICLLAVVMIAGALLADCQTTPCSLACRMVDWMDAPGETFYDDGNDCWPPDYSYSGTKNWDLAMGDSFMVWLPGTEYVHIINNLEQDSIEEMYSASVSPWGVKGVQFYQDTIVYFASGMNIRVFKLSNDSLIYIDRLQEDWADYHFAALEDSFLYTVGGPGGALTCINVADPESIFIYRTVEGGGSDRGLEVIDGYVYSAWDWLDYNELTGESELSYHVSRADMLNSPTPWVNHYYGPSYSNRSFGASANDGEFVYYVNTEIGSWPAWEIGESDLYVLDTDTSYNFDDKWDGQPAIGVDIVNEHLAAIGFKHGFSILDIDDLADIHEVAYYMDTDSQFYCTQFAMKDTVLYAVAHPAAGECRLYMFHVADSVASSIDENPPSAKPEAFEISAYPNPFNSAVTIALDIPVGDGSPVPISVEIYDVNGRRVATVTEPVEVPVGVEATVGRLAKDTSTSSVSVFAPLTKGGQGGSYIWSPAPSLPSGVYLVRARFDRLSDQSGCEMSRRVVYLK